MNHGGLILPPWMTMYKYNVMDDKKIEINSQKPPCTGGLKSLHDPIGT